MIESNINIIKEIVAYNTSLGIAEQLQVTEEFFLDYNGINPLLKSSISLGVYGQLEVAMKGIALDTFDVLYSPKTEKLSLASSSYYGFSKEGLETILKTLMFENTKKDIIIPNLASAYDNLKISLARTMLGLLIILLSYEAYREAGVLSQYMYMCIKVGA